MNLKKSIISVLAFSVMHLTKGADLIYNQPGNVITVSGVHTLDPDDIVWVKRGTVLKLTGTIKLSTKGRVIVDKGAMMILDGGTLSNTTNDESVFWSGVEIVGNDHMLDYSKIQADETWFLGNYLNLDCGIFKAMNNAEISYSGWGVITSTAMESGPTTGHAGGYFDISATTFTNNLFSSIYIQRTIDRGAHSNIQIKNCQFNTHFTSPKSWLNFNGQIYSNGGINILEINNCSFKAGNQSWNKATAISVTQTIALIRDCSISGFRTSISFHQNNLLLGYSGGLIKSCKIHHPYNSTVPAISIQNSDMVDIFSNEITCESNLTGVANPVIQYVGSDNFEIAGNTISFSNFNPQNVSNAIYLRNSSPFSGRLNLNSIFNMDYCIVTEGVNEGFRFTCNSFYNTKYNDLKIYSGKIAPMQGSELWPADNLYNPNPQSPLTRYNLLTFNQAKGFYYWYSAQQLNADPHKYSQPEIITNGSRQSKNSFHDCCEICLIKPGTQGGSETDLADDLNSSFTLLGLPLEERHDIIRNIDILGKSYDLKGFITRQQIDSAILLVKSDTGFFGAYHYSKLLLNKGLGEQALNSLEQIESTNSEIIHYKILFPLIKEGLLCNYDSSWFENSKTSLEYIASRRGFVAEQAKSMLLYFSDLSRGYNISQENQVELNVSPNPFQNSLKIELSSTALSSETLELQIKNLSGEIELSEIVSPNLSQQGSIELNTSNIPNGIYILYLKVNEQVTAYRYVIKSE